jgi:hypothetical protein
MVKMLEGIMESQIYIIIAIVVLAVLGAIVFFVRGGRRKQHFTPLTGMAFGFILAGILFGGDNRVFGYSFFGAAIVFAVVDMILKLRKGKKK